jgi:hypothetical protein
MQQGNQMGNQPKTLSDYLMLGGAGLGSLLGGNPADAGMEYLDKISGTMKEYMDPFINAGKGMLPSLQDQYGQLVNDPSGKLKQFGANFQQDPGYQWNLGEALRGANQAAAAGGMAGSPMAQQNAGMISSNMANNTYQDYLRNVMGLYGQGLGGQQGIYNTGFMGASNLSQDLAQALMSQAKMAYEGQAKQNNSMGGLFGGIAGALGGAGSSLTSLLGLL